MVRDRDSENAGAEIRKSLLLGLNGSKIMYIDEEKARVGDWFIR